MEEAALIFTDGCEMRTTVATSMQRTTKQVCLLKWSCFLDRKRWWGDLAVTDN